MRSILVIAFFLLGTVEMYGQLKPMDKLFKDKPLDLNLYLNPTFEYTQVALKHTKVAGVGAGVIINKKLSLGVTGSLTIPAVPLTDSRGSGNLKMLWGGLHFEYTLRPVQIVHLTFPFNTGMGLLEISEGTVGTPSGSRNFLFAEPGMLIESNVWKYAKIGIGTRYRYTHNVTYSTLTTDDLSGFSAVVSVKFGIFRYLKRDFDKLPR